MTDQATLRALLARVEAAEGPDRELDRAIHMAVGLGMDDEVHCGVLLNSYTASLDAAVALVERLFPGGGWSVARAHNCPEAEGKPFFADVASREFIEDMEAWGPSRGVIADAGGRMPALALCAAFLRVLIAKADSPNP